MMKKITVEEFLNAVEGKRWSSVDVDECMFVRDIEGRHIADSFNLKGAEQILLDTETGVYILDFGPEVNAIAFGEYGISPSVFEKYEDYDELISDEDRERAEEMIQASNRLMAGESFESVYGKVTE